MESTPWAKAFANLNQVDNAATMNAQHSISAAPPPPVYHNSNQYHIYSNFFPSAANQWNNHPQPPPVYNPPPPPAIVLPSQNTQQYGQPYNYTPSYSQMAGYQSARPQMQNGPGQPHSLANGMPRVGGGISFKIPKKSQQIKQQQNVVPRPPAPPARARTPVEQQNKTNKSSPGKTTTIPKPPPPPPPPTQTSQSSQNNNGSMNSAINNNNPLFTPELHDYCNRAYKLAKTDIERDRMEIILKGKITKVVNEGTQIDWTKEPLPMLASASTTTPPPLPQAAKPNYGPNSMKNRLDFESSFKNSKPFDTKYSNGKTSSNDYGKKRSSDSDDDEYIPLSSNKKRKAEEAKAVVSPKMSKRAKKRAAKLLREQQKITKGVVFSEAKQAERRARFQDQLKKNSENDSKIMNRITFNTFQDIGDGELNLDDIEPIVGTCQKLEKRYLRLTSAPDPATVRPLEVLRKSLEMVTNKWKTERDYSYACDQLKSIRQDVVVQCIQCEFAVQAYETAARIAIEGNDYTEFSQCQCKLAELYSQPALVGKCPNRREFLAYQILFYISNTNEGGLQTLLKKLSCEDRENELVAFALKVRTAIALSNYHGIFGLYKCAPAQCGLVMDWFIERERSKALSAVLKAFRPKIKTDWLKEEFSFESSLEFEKFIAKFNIIYINNNGTEAKNNEIDCKESHFAVQRQKAAEAVAASATQL